MKNLQTHFKIVIRDESEYWRDDILAKTGKIKTVLIYDELRSVNLAELTPSYDLTPMYYITENVLSDEDDEMLRDVFSDESSVYVHCNRLDQKVCDFDCGEEISEIDDDIEEYQGQKYQEILNARIEYERCNVRF